MHVSNYLFTHVKTKKYDFFTQVIPNTTLEEYISINQGGAALQLRNLSMNVVFTYVSRVVQSWDDDGIGASAHGMQYQMFSIGGIALLDLSVTAQTLVPSEVVKKKQKIIIN